MQNRHVIFAAASGRSMPGVASVFGNLWEKMIMITDNGACLWRGRERLWADTIPRSEWYPVVTRARAIPGTVVIACGYSEAYIEHPETMDERTVRELRKYYPAWESANFDEMMGDMVKIAPWRYRASRLSGTSGAGDRDPLGQGNGPDLDGYLRCARLQGNGTCAGAGSPVCPAGGNGCVRRLSQRSAYGRARREVLCPEQRASAGAACVFGGHRPQHRRQCGSEDPFAHGESGRMLR